MNNTTEVSTPSTMVPAAVKVIDNSAQTGTGELDYLKLALDAAKNKNGSMNFAKGNGLFSAVCSSVKSYLKIDKATRLPEDVANKIASACNAVKANSAELVNKDNIVYAGKTDRIRNGQLVQVVTTRGVNDYSHRDQIFIGKMKISELKSKLIKAELAYDDDAVRGLKDKIRQLEQVVLWNESQEKQLAELTTANK